MNSKNSKTSDPHRLILNLSNKIHLKRSVKHVALSKLLYLCYAWKNIEKSYKTYKFKISTPTLNDEFELPDGSYIVSAIRSIRKNMKHSLITC